MSRWDKPQEGDRNSPLVLLPNWRKEQPVVKILSLPPVSSSRYEKIEQPLALQSPEVQATRAPTVSPKWNPIVATEEPSTEITLDEPRSLKRPHSPDDYQTAHEWNYQRLQKLRGQKRIQAVEIDTAFAAKVLERSKEDGQPSGFEWTSQGYRQEKHLYVPKSL